MGFESYKTSRLREILEHWETVNPSPGSLGDKARQACEEEIRRRALAAHPAGSPPDHPNH